MSIHSKMDKLILTLKQYEFKKVHIIKIKATGCGISGLITTVKREISPTWNFKNLMICNLDIIDHRFETLENETSLVDVLIEMKFVILTFGSLLKFKKAPWSLDSIIQLQNVR